MDEHTKLARVAVDLPSAAEGMFRTNVAKMTVGLPEALRPQLRVIATGIVSRAQDVYRRRARAVPDAPASRESGYEIANPGGATIGDYWPLITEVLECELVAHPELLDRVLLELVNAGRAQRGDGSPRTPAVAHGTEPPSRRARRPKLAPVEASV